MIVNEITLTESHIRYEITRRLQPIINKYEKEIIKVPAENKDKFIADIALLLSNTIKEYLNKVLSFKCDVNVFRLNNSWSFDIQRSFTLNKGSL